MKYFTLIFLFVGVFTALSKQPFAVEHWPVPLTQTDIWMQPDAQIWLDGAVFHFNTSKSGPNRGLREWKGGSVRGSIECTDKMYPGSTCNTDFFWPSYVICHACENSSFGRHLTCECDSMWLDESDIIIKCKSEKIGDVNTDCVASFEPITVINRLTVVFFFCCLLSALAIVLYFSFYKAVLNFVGGPLWKSFSKLAIQK